MPEDAPITFLPSELPEGICYPNDQARFNGFAAALLGFLPGSYSTFVIGADAPMPADQQKPWIRLIGGNLDRIYVYNGLWLAPHPIPASSAIRMMWAGSLSDLQTFEGGEAGAITATTGAFWVEDTDMRARMPVGVGTLPDSGTIVAVGGAAGEEYVTLTTATIPAHTHGFTVVAKNSDASGSGAITGGAENIANDGEFTGTTAAGGGGASHNNMPPYRGLYFIKRSARQFYRAS